MLFGPITGECVTGGPSPRWTAFARSTAATPGKLCRRLADLRARTLTLCFDFVLERSAAVRGGGVVRLSPARRAGKKDDPRLRRHLDR